MSALQVTRHGRVLGCVLNRPRSLNALTLDMVRELRQVYGQAAADPDCRVLVLRGAGGKAFCAGGDMKALAEDALTGGSLARNFFHEEYELNALIATWALPAAAPLAETSTRSAERGGDSSLAASSACSASAAKSFSSSQRTQVSLWDGIVMGGGAGLSVHGKFRVATERTIFAMPECALGFFPDVGASHFLNGLGSAFTSQVGAYIALTGARVGARDAFQLGLATHFIPSDLVTNLEGALAECSCAQEVDDCLRELGGGAEPPLADAKESIWPHLQSIERCFAKGCVRQIIAALEAEDSAWARHTAGTLRKQSPTSLAVTLHLLRQNAGRPLRECLAAEYELALKMTAPPRNGERPSDFFEGVRAVLIDKDQRPAWQPQTIDELDIESVVHRYFWPPEAGVRLTSPRTTERPGKGSMTGNMPPRAQL